MEESTAIFIIDMLKGFLEPNHPLFCGENARQIIPNILDLLNSKNKAKIFYICDSHDPDDLEFQMFPPHCIEGTKESEIIDELKPYDGTIITKKRFSAFYKTNLEEKLDIMRPDRIIVVGVCSDICVLYAVADLRARDYEVIVPAYCVASFDPSGHKWALHHMEKVLGAKLIMDKEELI